MKHVVILMLAMWLTAAVNITAQAQNAATEAPIWVQIEAQPSLREAQSRIRAYSARLPDVAGFQLRAPWYGIMLGPYDRTRADQVLNTLRSAGQIPDDSFLAFPRNFGRQFWPIGAQTTQPTAPLPAPQTAPEGAPVIPDETLAEARINERQLLRTEREVLQRMLQWAGTYTSTIDGAFGPGTRRAMGEWQLQNGYEVTGVMTTGQRAALLAAYNAILDGLDLVQVEDAEAGVSVLMPTALVARAGAIAPFVRYEPIKPAAQGAVQPRVVLISQPGGPAELKGLFDIMQSLAIVPKDGPRRFEGRSFALEGLGSQLHSKTYAQTSGGQIRGFTLVWPLEDRARGTRLWEAMRESLVVIPGGLDPLRSPAGEQAIDLISGLEIQSPRRRATGFFIDETGQLITADLGQCGVLQMQDETPLRVVLQDADLDLMVLDPIRGVAPLAVASFQGDVPRPQDDVRVAGYSYGGLLGAPTLSFGRLADLQGLNGEETLDRLALRALPGDAGGPVFDRGGAVLGLLRTREEQTERLLPDEVNFSTDARAIRERLEGAGIPLKISTGTAEMDAIDLQALAADMTMVVECWE